MKYVVVSVLMVTAMAGCESMQSWDPEIPQDKTTIGAATGGVLGAGLGAIVGNQTGDPGTGLVVGALAGAGTGAAIGNSLDNQDQALDQQDQAIKRQETALSAHEREIQSMRGTRGDYPRTATTGSSTAGSYSASSPRSYPAYPTRVDSVARNNAADLSARDASPPPLHESNLVGSNEGASVAPALPAAKYAQDDWRARPRPNDSPADIQPAPKTGFETSNSNIGDTTTSTASARDAGALGQGDDCTEAQREASKGDAAADGADKLFHFRRALRLCPSDPRLHNSLGKTYVKLNRKADAEFEFNEALNLNPGFDEARRNLDGIRGKG